MKVSRILYLIAIIFSSFPLLARRRGYSFCNDKKTPLLLTNRYHYRKNKRNTFQIFLDQWVIKKYQYPEEALEKKIEGRVIVTLRIDKEGFLSIKEVKGRNPLLEEEACRIFDGFPQLSPALLRGKPVNIVYNYPVIFRIIQ